MDDTNCPAKVLVQAIVLKVGTTIISSPGNLSEMQIFSSHPGLTESEMLEAEPRNLCCKSLQVILRETGISFNAWFCAEYHKSITGGIRTISRIYIVILILEVKNKEQHSRRLSNLFFVIPTENMKGTQPTMIDSFLSIHPTLAARLTLHINVYSLVSVPLSESAATMENYVRSTGREFLALFSLIYPSVLTDTWPISGTQHTFVE